MYKGQSITVIIPCLNEEQGIEKMLRAMPDFVDEVIVVDNNSTDRTSEVAASLGAKVIREEVRGYGRAYKRGFADATSDIIITLDGEMKRWSSMSYEQLAAELRKVQAYEVNVKRMRLTSTRRDSDGGLRSPTSFSGPA